jgi:hypothetical protein
MCKIYISKWRASLQLTQLYEQVKAEELEGLKSFLFVTKSRPGLGLMQPPDKLVLGETVPPRRRADKM